MELTAEQEAFKIQQEQLAIQNLFDSVLNLAQCIKNFNFEYELTEADCRFPKEKIDILFEEFKKLQTDLRVFDLGNMMKEMQHYSNIPLWFDPEKPENGVWNILSSQFLSIPWDNLHTIIGTTVLDKSLNIEPAQREYFKRMGFILTMFMTVFNNIHQRDLIVKNEVK